jgi:hypothetical protein
MQQDQQFLDYVIKAFSCPISTVSYIFWNFFGAFPIKNVRVISAQYPFTFAPKSSRIMLFPPSFLLLVLWCGIAEFSEKATIVGNASSPLKFLLNTKSVD